jgi:hypothetical protein
MATRLNILTCLQQAQGLAEVAYRCAQPRSLRLLTLRAPAPQTAAQSRLRVRIDVQNPHDTPYPVRIIYVSGAASGTALQG